MSSEVIGQHASEQTLAFIDESDEESARDSLVEYFSEKYNKFFDPKNPLEMSGTGEKVLTSLDFHSGGGILAIIHDHFGSKLAVPYLNLNERFMYIIKKDLDPSFIKGIRRNERGKIPNLEGLSDRMSWYLEKEVFIYSSSYILTPYNNGVQRAVERLNVAKDSGQNPIGEIWLGSKWRPGRSSSIESASNSIELVKAA